MSDKGETFSSLTVGKHLFSLLKLYQMLILNTLAVQAPDSPDTFQTPLYYEAAKTKIWLGFE